MCSLPLKMMMTSGCEEETVMFEEEKITITKRQLIEANATAACNAMRRGETQGLSGVTAMTFVLIGGLLNAELVQILFPEKDPEDKLAKAVEDESE